MVQHPISDFPCFWKGMKCRLAGVSASWFSGRCLVQQGGSQGTACVWIKVDLSFPQKVRKDLDCPQGSGPAFAACIIFVIISGRTENMGI